MTKRNLQQISFLTIVFFLCYLIYKKNYLWETEKLVNTEFISQNPIVILPKAVQVSLNATNDLLPAARSIIQNGKHFVLLKEFRFTLRTEKEIDDLVTLVDRFRDYFTTMTKLTTRRTVQIDNQYFEQLIIDASAIDLYRIKKYPELNEIESYKLTINESGSFLSSDSLTGLHRGLASFIQLIHIDHDRGILLPNIQIEDSPRFSWRGLMIDVSRHWMPYNVIRRTIDAMELSKLNVLHLHLSDDQGFRLESLRFPLLHDRTNYFTQEQMKDIVEYARRRRIRVVPEFDIPGHTTSWFIGYPELTSEPGPYRIETRWGVFQPTIDPSQDSTYEFLDEFFKEMTQIFPDPYFHIGGDEVEGSQWKRSESIQKFANENNLHTNAGIQAFFNKKIQRLLHKYEKSVVGWEEIMEERHEALMMKTDAIIHSWRSKNSLFDAVKRGYRAILSNGFYLDAALPSEYYYKNDPVTEKDAQVLSDEEINRIVGGEACMWAEFVSSKTIDSRIWPRVLSVAERLWSPSNVVDQNSVYRRLFRLGHLFNRLNLEISHTFSSLNRGLSLYLPSFPRKDEFLIPLTILARASEALGHPQRSQTGFYDSTVPLTTFIDTLVPESEFIWKLETSALDNGTLHSLFELWSVNDLHLRRFFENLHDMKRVKRVLVQNVEHLSKNLAEVGRIGLRLLNYKMTGNLHQDKNNTMNNWSIKQYFDHHYRMLQDLELQVAEIRLAAVRPVLRLLTSLF